MGIIRMDRFYHECEITGVEVSDSYAAIPDNATAIYVTDWFQK